MAIHGPNKDKIVNAIRKQATFSVASMTGYPSNGMNEPNGRLEGTSLAAFRADVHAGMVTYVVKSYGTVIGWQTSDGMAHVPSDSYSQTTSNHQGIARFAFASNL